VIRPSGRLSINVIIVAFSSKKGDSPVPLSPEFLQLAKKLGADAADQGLSQEAMAGAIVKFRHDWADVVPAEAVEEFLLQIAEEYYRHREVKPVN
jgi:hypothetical protein